MKSFLKITYLLFITLACLCSDTVSGQTRFIIGSLYYNVNNNCERDFEEVGIANRVVTLTPGPLYALTNYNGDYFFEVEGGMLYTISIEESDDLYDYLEIGCSGSETFASVGPDQTLSNIDFAFASTEECPVIEVTANVGPLVPGQSSQLIVNYANIGTADANDVFINVFLDPSVFISDIAFNEPTGVNSSLTNPTDTLDVSMIPVEPANDAPEFALINNQISLPNLSPGASGYLSLEVSVDPNAIPNSSACIQVEASPQEYCGVVNPLWDGSEISVSGTCTEDSIEFVISNQGEDMDDIITIGIYEDVILSFIRDLSLEDGEDFIITLPVNGSTYTLVAEQSAYYPGYDKPTVSIEGCSSDGQNISYGYVNDFAQNDTDPFKDILCSEIAAGPIGNEKSVSPGLGVENYVEAGQILEYTITYFNPDANPGSLIIEDELSPYLDINTLKFGRGSDDIDQISITENRTIVWEAFSDYSEGDGGYVSFTVQVAEDVPQNTQINNQALITFGDNLPFDSNTSSVVVCDDCVSQQIPQSLQAKVFLEGVYQDNGTMATTLTNQMPIHQPYHVEPYRYYGNEQIVFSPASQSIVDWVLVEARYGPLAISGERNSVTIETKAALLYSDGSIRSIDGSLGVTFDNLLTGNEYYFCVRHRNHLDVVTAYPISPTNLMVYDFTNNITQAFGASQMKVANDGKAMLFGADFNSDGIIQATDYDKWSFLPAAVNVYEDTDVNLDGVIQATDYDIWFNNKAKVGAVEINF